MVFMETTEVSGAFWLSGVEGRKVKGVLNIGGDVAPSIVLGQGLVTIRVMPEPATKATRQTESEADAAVSLITPPSAGFTVHGELDDGTAVSLLDCVVRHSRGGIDLNATSQEIQGLHLVVGVHADTLDGIYDGARVGLETTPILKNGETAVLANGGVLEAAVSEGQRFLQLTGLPGEDYYTLQARMIQPIASLVQLACGQATGVRFLAIRQSDSGRWFEVYSSARATRSRPWPDGAFLNANDLSLATIARWLDQTDRLGPVVAGTAALCVVQPVIEQWVLGLTTLAEGLHRALFNTQRLSVEVADQIRAAAIGAVGTIHDEAEQIVRGALMHIEEISYNKRLRELGAAAEEILPGVIGQSSKWKQAVYGSRNYFAHRGDNTWMTRDQIDEWLAVCLSLSWVLRVILLHHSGIPSAVLVDRTTKEQYRLYAEQVSRLHPKIYSPQ